MRWRDRIAKAFRLGPATVDAFETTFGHDQERYAPAAYGDYPATNAAVFACSSIRAKNLAKLRLRIYKRAANGERVEVTSGRLFDLMRSVNGYWTFRRLIRMTEMSLCTYGQAFWVLENGVEGRTAAQSAPRAAGGRLLSAHASTTPATARRSPPRDARPRPARPTARRTHRRR